MSSTRLHALRRQSLQVGESTDIGQDSSQWAQWASQNMHRASRVASPGSTGNGESRCGSCEALLPVDASFCPGCGTAQQAPDGGWSWARQRRSRRRSTVVRFGSADASSDCSGDGETGGAVSWALRRPSVATDIGLSRPLATEPVDEELWSENQELHDRILDLEERLREAHALVEEEDPKAAMFSTNSVVSRQRHRRGSLNSVASTGSTIFGSGEAVTEASEAQVSQRSRLRWLSAIRAVRLRNARMKGWMSNLKLKVAEDEREAAQSALEELASILEVEKKASEEQGARMDMERSTLRELYVLEKSHLERENQAFKDRVFELERASHLGVTSDEFTDQLVALKDGPERKRSLAEDLQDVQDYSGDRSWGNSAVSSEAHGLSAGSRQEPAELEQLQLYTQALEARVAQAALDREEAAALRHKVCELEQLANEAQKSEQERCEFESQPWWQRVGQVCCTTGRTSRTSLGEPPLLDAVAIDGAGPALQAASRS